MEVAGSYLQQYKAHARSCMNIEKVLVSVGAPRQNSTRTWEWDIQCESKKISAPRARFSQRLRILNQNLARLLHGVPSFIESKWMTKFYSLLSNFDKVMPTKRYCPVNFYISLKNAKNCDMSATAWPIFTKFAHVHWCRMGLSNALPVTNFNFKNPRWQRSILHHYEMSRFSIFKMLAVRILDFDINETTSSCHICRH